jgi:LPS O-antigen subunit length determinant protein (WzzB/FepE family)
MESIGTDIAPYIRAVWRRKWFIISIVLLVAAISLILGLREPRVYASTALIKVGRIWNEQIEDPYVVTEIINSQPFLSRLGQRLSTKQKPRALSQALTAERLEGGKARNRYVYLIRLTARGSTPEEAKELVRAAADQIIEQTAEKFESAYPVYTAREKALQERIDTLKATISSAGSPTSLAAIEAQRLDLQSIEKELFETQLNNQSPLKTYRTQLAEEISAPRVVPGVDIYKRVLMSAASAFAMALLGALVLEFGLPVLKPQVVGKTDEV